MPFTFVVLNILPLNLSYQWLYSGNYDVILDGIHENILQLQYHDPVMQKTVRLSPIYYVDALFIWLYNFVHRLFFCLQWNIYHTFVLFEGQMLKFSWNLWSNATVCYANTTNVPSRWSCAVPYRQLPVMLFAVLMIYDFRHLSDFIFHCSLSALCCNYFASYSCPSPKANYWVAKVVSKVNSTPCMVAVEPNVKHGGLTISWYCIW